MRYSAKTDRSPARRGCAWVLTLLQRAGRGAWPLAFGLSLAAVAARGADDEPCLKVTTDHFTIITPADEAAARKWAAELEQFRRGLQGVVPVDAARLRPVTVVLFKNDKAMEPYVPLEKGRPAKLGGLFVRANDVNTIMLSLARDAAETRHVVFHEAVHWHLSALDGVMPLWLGEGLAELYATFELPDARTYAFGAAMPDYVSLLRGRKILPLAQLLAIDRDSLLYNEGTRANIFYAESWAFVHFLFYGEESPGRASVGRYLDELHAGTAPAEAFRHAFGGDYATVEQRLRRYIRSGTYHKYVYPRTISEADSRLVVATATPAEIELARGSLLYGARTAEDAEPHLRRAAELAPADPRAWELLGHIAIGRRDFDAALPALARAAAAGSTSYLVYHNLPVSRMPATVVPGRLLTGAEIDPPVMDLAAADYRKAIALAPAHVPSYEGLAGLIYSMATFRAADVDLLVRGLLLSPGNAMIETGIAAGEIRSGHVAEGRARLARICERNLDRQNAGIQFARRLYTDELLKADLADIERLASENHFDAAMAVADRALARDLEPANRQVVSKARRQLAGYQTVNAAVTLANDGDVSGATKMLQDFVGGSDADNSARDAAERLLRDIARQQQLRQR